MARVYDEDASLQHFERYRFSRRGLVKFALTGGIGIALGASAVYLALQPQISTGDQSPAERSSDLPGSPTEIAPPTVEREKIVIAIQDDLQSLSPLDWTREGPGASTLVKNYYETFMNHQRDIERFGRMKRLPALALKVESVRDFRTIRVFLRDGIRFHNGSKLTSEAIKPSIEAYAQSSRLGSMFRDVSEVEEIDHLTADIKWGRNSVDNFAKVTHLAMPYIFSPDLLSKDGSAGLSKEVDGTGPYKVKEWQPGEFLTLQTNPEYWGDKLPDNQKTQYHREAGNIQEITYVTITDSSAQLAALENGDVDVVLFSVAISEGRINKIPGVRAYSSGPSAMTMIYMNTLYEPLEDKRVRLAIANAVNPNELSDLLEQQYFIPDSLLLPWMLGSDKKTRAIWPSDLNRSRVLLAEAGFKDGFDLTIAPSKVPFTHTLISTAMRGKLLEVGIKARVRSLDVSEWITIANESPNQTSIHMYSVNASYDDESLTYFDQWWGKGRGRASMDHPELEEMIEEARTLESLQKREVIYREASQYVVDNVLQIVPLHVTHIVVA
ncbi:MAG: ABC transporter substrate-binding protein, partial [Thaumarchaeota archaeon]|nr:ABC transporter substrate-binding protein [Nitrososphaerota archaeon]